MSIFQDFFYLIGRAEFPMNTNMIAYSVLKTEGDILVDMGFFDKAIKAYKTAKDFTEVWGPSFNRLKMRLYE